MDAKIKNGINELFSRNSACAKRGKIAGNIPFSRNFAYLAGNLRYSRAMILSFAVWISVVVSVFAESYPNRPTVSEMDGIVISGTQCARGVNERCWATQYQTNPVAYQVAPFTNTTGFYLDQSLMGTMATKIKSLVPYYANPDTVYDGTTNISMYTVPGLFAELDIGDHANQFTRTFASGTNAAVYGDSPWRICEDNLNERYDALNALQKTLAQTPDGTNSYNRYGRSGSSYSEIQATWDEESWRTDLFPNSVGFAAAWVDNYGSGPWTLEKVRGYAQFYAPESADASYTIDLYGHVKKEGEGPSPEFLTFEAPGNEYDLLLLNTFSSPLTPGAIYSDTTIYGDSAVIVPDPGALPSGTVRGWAIKGYALVNWIFQYCR